MFTGSRVRAWVCLGGHQRVPFTDSKYGAQVSVRITAQIKNFSDIQCMDEAMLHT
jgi:hypothetical protein